MDMHLINGSIMEVKMKELSIKEQKSLFGGHFHTVGDYRCPGLLFECMFIGGSGAAAW